MALNHEQKRYIKRNARESTVSKLAADLNIPEKEIATYLKDQWKADKFEKYIHKKDTVTEEMKPAEGPVDLLGFIKKNWMHIAFLVVLIGIVFFNSLFNGFVSDDVAVIRDSREIGNASFVFRDPFAFLRTFFYFIIFSFFGKNPLPYHLMNILFHTGTTVLLFVIIGISLNVSVAFLTTSLFAIHPIISEPVTWVSGGTYPQQSFFVMASLLTLILFLRSKKQLFYAISIILNFLALVSADKAMVLPLLFTLYLFIFTNIKKTWKYLIPYYGLTFIWVLHYAFRLTERVASVQHEQFRKEITFNPFTQTPVAISSYFELMVWPDKLSIYHSDFVMSTMAFVLRVIVFLTFIGSLIYTFFKKKYIFFGLAFFIIALLPTLSPLGISSLMAERYTYIGSAGIFFIVALGVWNISKNKKYETATYLIFMLVIAVLSIRTIMRNFDWRNEDTLWIATGRTAIYDPVTHMNLGDMHRRHKNYTEAEREFKIAMQISPTNAYAYYNLGLVYTEAGAFPQALAMYNKALELDPTLWQSYQNISVVYSYLNENEKALEYIQKANAASPNTPSILTNLGVIYLKLGQKEKAQQALSQSLRLDPTDEKARSGLTDALK